MDGLPTRAELQSLQADVIKLRQWYNNMAQELAGLKIEVGIIEAIESEVLNA